MYTPTAFRIATTFNADLSKWNTAAVITLHWSTSTAYLHLSFASVFISAVHFVLLCLFTQSHPFLFFYMYIPLKFSYVQHLKKLINSMQISQSGTRQRWQTCLTVRPLHLFFIQILVSYTSFHFSFFSLSFVFCRVNPSQPHVAWHTLIIQHLLKLLYSTQTFPSGTPLRRETCKKVGSTSLSSLFLLYMYRVFSFFLLFHMFFFFSLSFFTFGKQCLHIPIISMWIFQSGTPLLSGRCMKVRPAFLSLFYMYCGCYIIVSSINQI